MVTTGHILESFDRMLADGQRPQDAAVTLSVKYMTGWRTLNKILQRARPQALGLPAPSADIVDGQTPETAPGKRKRVRRPLTEVIPVAPSLKPRRQRNHAKKAAKQETAGQAFVYPTDMPDSQIVAQFLKYYIACREENFARRREEERKDPIKQAILRTCKAAGILVTDHMEARLVALNILWREHDMSPWKLVSATPASRRDGADFRRIARPDERPHIR